MRFRIPALLFVAAAGGCVAEAGVGYQAQVVAPAPVVAAPTVEATATVETAPAPAVEVDASPELVEVQPGVQVVYDYDDPVFFTDGFYWRFYGGTWYRSTVHTGGWVVYNDVPAHIRGISNPRMYAHYRPAGYVPRARTAPVRNGATRPVVNGRPAETRPVVNGRPAETRPVVNGRPAETRPVYNGGVHTAPVVNGGAHTAPVVNGGGHTAPVYNGGAKTAPAKTAPKKDERDHRH